MPKVSEVLQPKYVGASDIGERRLRLKVRSVTVEQLRGDSRLVVWFERARKGVVLDFECAEALSKEISDDTAAWHGLDLEVLVERKFRKSGGSFDGVTVRVPRPVETGSDEVPF